VIARNRSKMVGPLAFNAAILFFAAKI
jgi:hypothetical protein